MGCYFEDYSPESTTNSHRKVLKAKNEAQSRTLITVLTSSKNLCHVHVFDVSVNFAGKSVSPGSGEENKMDAE